MQKQAALRDPFLPPQVQAVRDHGQASPTARAQVLQHALHPCLRGERPMAGGATWDQGPTLRLDVRQWHVEGQVSLLPLSCIMTVSSFIVTQDHRI